jgi:hypothetical protein
MVIFVAVRCREREGVDPPHKAVPRKRLPADLRSLARGHTELCIKVLAGIDSQEAVPPAARVAAAGILLDRGWGKAPTTHTGADGEDDIKVTIRHIVEGRDAPRVISNDTQRALVQAGAAKDDGER